MCIDNGPAHWWRQCALILLWDLRWWNWGQQRGHPGLIKQIGFGVQCGLGDASFRRALFRADSVQHDGAKNFVLNLRRAFKQWTNLRPLVRRFSTLLSLFGHGHRFSRMRHRQTDDLFPEHYLRAFSGCEQGSFVPLWPFVFREMLPTRVKHHLSRFPAYRYHACSITKFV